MSEPSPELSRSDNDHAPQAHTGEISWEEATAWKAKRPQTPLEVLECCYQDKYGNTVDLSLIDPTLREYAKKAFDERDVIGLLCLLEDTKRLDFVALNRFEFPYMGIYETCLVEAYTMTRANHCLWKYPMLAELFDLARKRLLASER